ncbi:non-ribosomal peptide synthetase [Antrihabitans sp. YC2-6]|uniref:non-ribosomal peptide synthetase n=1 Tax=Antrihabitans sp. YC2-6 TaxID=2799498 RepID=UPI001F1BBD8C|nr:non-ribosomal peptide synthetase [Antrihabitans sp. YC2-6]
MSDDIAARRKLLLAQRLRESGLAASESTARVVRKPGVRSALSAGQRRMWFVQTRDPQDTTLNICVAYRLVGALDEDRLRAAFATVLERHEVLRTTYGVDDDGEPYQVAHAGAEVAWQRHDITDLPEQSRPRRLEVLTRREFGRAFDLSTDLPLRVTTVRTGPEETALVLTIHHIAWDDDSWRVFFAEVNSAYNNGDLPTLRAQYVDVEVLDGAEPAAADLDYWRNTLTPLPEPLELPGQRSYTAVSKNADHLSVEVPADLMRRVGDFAREQSATAYMVLLAAFDAVVFRYTAAADFVVAAPVTNRRGPDADALIGYFGNTVLIRSSFDRAATFTDVVATARDAAAGAFAHQSVGLDRVIREVNPDRVAGQDVLAQLVQLSFSARSSADGFALAGIDATELRIGSAVTQESLGLMVVSQGESARIEAEYLVDALERPVVEQLLTNYVKLLDSVLSDPAQRICDIDMLGDAGKASILEVSHGPLVDAAPATLIGLFEEQARASAGALAVTSDQIDLTYAELNNRANRLAHWLIGQGVAPEHVVALEFTTSVEFLVASLAVLKSGAAYLPIDPAYPADRIEYLIDDAAPKLRLDPESLAAAEAQSTSLPEANPTDTDRVTPLRPDNLAYVIYTSGSTGTPKGVPVSHAAIAEHVSLFASDFGMTSQDRLLQSSSVSFDASMMDIFVTFAVGARLVVPKPNAFRDIPYVAELITRKGVTVLHMVPSMLSTFLLLPEVSEWRNLRFVPVGGEALPGEVADRFGNVFDAELRNHYGPTEAVVASTRMPVDGPQGTRIVPIGTPNKNVYLYLLDDALQLVPMGVVGEIYIGGNQLARGYHDRSSLTAERFVADPFQPGGRLYRTGDLARRNGDGDIEFVGRSDEQVKIRGFRIELGEVEAVISSHPTVAHCVVVATENEALGAMLAAYVVPERDEEIVIEQLRAHAAAILPDHMVPAAFGVIEEVPTTAHGKLDRRALPEPILMVAREYREPSTPTEKRVAGLFGRIFGRDRIGADDSFFELGGHSLLAARLVTQIRSEFGIEIDVRVPFDTPTVAGLAAHLVAAFRDEFDIDLDDEFEDLEPTVESSRPELTERERPDDVPVSYSQLAMWFQHRLEGPSAMSNIPFAVRLDGPLDLASLSSAVNDVVNRHEALRTNFVERDGLPYQVVRPVESFEIPVTEIASSELDSVLADVATYCFDIESELLIRARIFALDERTHVLSVLAHHMVADHGSFSVFLADLAAAYGARSTGQAPTWNELPIQYADYALWQREILQSSFGESELEYWRGALAGLPDEITVAHDRPRPPVLGKSGELAVFTVPASVRTRVKALAEETGASEFMTCQAAVVTMLHALGGGNDLALGTPIAGRVDEATTDLVGLFANMVILRNDLSGNPTLRDVLLRGRDSALGAYGHQELPIERLVEALNPKRTRSRNPLFQAMMHFRDREQRLDLTGDTTLTMLPVDFDISFLDINVNFAVEADGAITTRIVVSKDLYDPATAELMAETLAKVFDAFAQTPDVALDELDLVPAAERDRVLEWGKGTQQALPLDACTADDPDVLARSIVEQHAETVRADAQVLASLALSGVSMMPSVRLWIVNAPAGPASLNELLVALAPESTVTYEYRIGDAILRDGRPVEGSRVQVLDEKLRVLPHGVVGDVFVDGVKTAERARWSSTGALVFDSAATEVEVPRRTDAVTGPASDTERVLIEILEELLEIDDVTPEDGFFALGGDSVISIQWSGRANNLGLPLTPQMVFEFFTISELAAAVDEARAAPETVAEEPAEQHTHAPMTASGLGADALAALSASWNARS